MSPGVDMNRVTAWLGAVMVMTGLFGAAAAAPRAQEAGDRIDITIRNFTYQFPVKVLRPDQPVTIRLRNQDTVEHGFRSPMLSDTEVRVDTAAGSTFGRGIKVIHVLPGQEVSIYLTAPPPGQYPFECDLHPKMKGELFLLSVGTA